MTEISTPPAAPTPAPAFEQSASMPAPAFPEPTTKPAGSTFSTASIVMAIISVFIGGYILAAAAIGFGIRARMMHQPRAAIGISLGVVSVVLNTLVMIFLA